MLSIIDWRMQQCETKGVEFRFNLWAEAEDVLALEPDLVIIATGGIPDVDVLENNNHLLVSSWDIISGAVAPKKNVLLFDDAGDHSALQAAQIIAHSGATLEIMTPDRSFAPDVMAMNLVPYMRDLQDKDVTFTVTYRLQGVQVQADKLKAILSSDYTQVNKSRLVDQVVVNHGTLPLDELYFDLKPLSSNLGEVNYAHLLSGDKQQLTKNAQGRFQLFRIGDAVSSRNIHAGIYDALRLLKDL